MAKIRPILRLALVGVLALVALSAWLFWSKSNALQPSSDRPHLAMMTSLPIYWPEGADFASLASGGGELPWVRQTIELRYQLTPLDTLAGLGTDTTSDPLADVDRLLIVQPRGLSPADNVAIDNWVRAGGRLLYVLDPMLTGHYHVSLGDPRHPTAIGLVPPIVTRWGVGQRFDEGQSAEMRLASYGRGQLPVQFAGDLFVLDADDSASDDLRAARGDCQILGDGIAATCQIGEGSLFLLADAVLFELHEAEGESPQQLLQLLEVGFSDEPGA